MANKNKLAQELAALSDSDWYTVLEEARDRRMERYAKQKRIEEPKPGASPEQVAAWIAQGHFASDPYVKKILYLPANAPRKEIRLLEVNAMLTIPELEKAEPFDYTSNVAGLGYRVAIIDITPDQWKRIQKGEPVLPEKWNLKGAVTFLRE